MISACSDYPLTIYQQKYPCKANAIRKFVTDTIKIVTTPEKTLTTCKLTPHNNLPYQMNQIYISKEFGCFELLFGKSWLKIKGRITINFYLCRAFKIIKNRFLIIYASLLQAG